MFDEAPAREVENSFGIAFFDKYYAGLIKDTKTGNALAKSFQLAYEMGKEDALKSFLVILNSIEDKNKENTNV